MTAGRYPDFLCIGAQKAGTSWLYEVLRRHPQIWLPPIKELHYFDHRRLDFPRRLSYAILKEQEHFRKGLSGSPHSLSVSPLAQMLRGGSDRTMLLRYAIGARNDSWYRALFAPAGDRIAGDITPAYARLSSVDVAYVHARMPDAKIIYLLRNPIERSWSQAAMHLSQRGRRKGGAVDITAFLESAQCRANTEYLANLARWEKHYPPEQILIGFLDEIAATPGDFLTRVFRHLGVDPIAMPATAHEKVFEGARPSIPTAAARRLAELHAPLLEDLHARFNNPYTQDWLDKARAILQGPALQAG
jgi:hypothetical protein